jgi:hypothetical protein
LVERYRFDGDSKINEISSTRLQKSRILRYGSARANADATASDKTAVDSSARGLSESTQENDNQGFELREGNQQTAELASTPTAHLPRKPALPKNPQIWNLDNQGISLAQIYVFKLPTMN